MSHTADEGAVPVAPRGDRSDAALDAALSAANAGMIAAIRRGLDLDAGLAQIIGGPPPMEIRSPVSTAANNRERLLSVADLANGGRLPPDAYICTVDVGTQIARLRFRILDLVRQSQIGESATVLLRAAASNLQDLHRGLEGRRLSRQEASNRLDVVALALETASDVEASEIACVAKTASSEDPDHFISHTSTRDALLAEERVLGKRRFLLAGSPLLALGMVLLSALVIALPLFDMSWLRGVLAALELKSYDAAETAVIAVNVAILGLLVFRVHRRLFRLFRRRSERIYTVTEAIKARAALRCQDADAGKAVAVLRKSVPSGDRDRSEATYITLLHAVAKLQRPSPGAATSRIDVLREELDSLRPNVMKLFDGADDCSPCPR